MDEFEHLKIRLRKIKIATDTFHKDKVIGAGAFGKVYKGMLTHYKGQSMVAFKRLDSRFGQGNKEFWKEIMMLSRYPHENIISLLGYCDTNGEKILIYEHASNGSLDRHLHSKTFTWIQRLKVCLGAARGLCYLHDDKGTQQRVLHRDVKSSNILLDDKWNAKVSDMGLSKLGPANQTHTALITNVVGTLGYVDPAYMDLNILTKESDVYSFGVVLFEVLCGKLCFEKSNDSFPSLVPIWEQKYKEKKLKEIIFQHLVQEMDSRSLETYSDIAFQCLHKRREERPTMSLLVEKLEAAIEFQETYEEMKQPKYYEHIIKSAVHVLTYKSLEELKSSLSKGVLLNGSKTWFSLNENGEHCEMISAAECVIPTEETSSFDEYESNGSSRFPRGYCYITYDGVFKAHIRTQFLSPYVTYTVNLVFKRPGEVLTSIKPLYVGICYRLEGETKSSVSCLADVREDGWLTVELFQFESQRGNVDIEISFKGVWDCASYHYVIEGIEFRPIEKVEHEVLEDDKQTISESDDTYWENKLPNDYDDIIKWSKDDVKWTTKKELYSILCKGFLMSNGQGWFFLAKSGKIKCLMLPARAALLQEQWKWSYEPESRFGQVAFDPSGPTHSFSIVYNIKSQILSPETTYACYLVYRLPEETNFDIPLKVKDENFHDGEGWLGLNNLRFIYLLHPQTPVIGKMVGHKSHNPLNRPKLSKSIPRQRDDGWMEVQVCEVQTSTTVETISMRVGLGTTFQWSWDLKGLTVQGVEFRPE
ncbi:putative protein kinase RLK-Pelle-CrRLK1L-1 family [Helianthus anomalus]